jgi:hypothetical protein
VSCVRDSVTVGLKKLKKTRAEHSCSIESITHKYVEHLRDICLQKARVSFAPRRISLLTVQ